MKILNKKIIASYAEVILDLMEHNPSKENTKNISETLEEIYEEWDELYSELTEDEIVSYHYEDIYQILDKLTTIAAEYVVADAYLDYDNDDMVYGLIQLVRYGKEE